ncbi:hypothetical protein ACS0TY_021946 [Phlomoides rotata]
MAEAFFKVLIENVTSLIQREIGFIMGVDKEMKKLSNTLTSIQKVLEDAEDKQFQCQTLRHWLGELNGVACEIEDILDECNTEVSKLKRNGGKFNLKKILHKRKIGRRMKEAVENLKIFHWMTHGCISSSGTQEVEDVGDQIWNELALRSFFQEIDTSGRETTFKMHDHVHDLAQSIMKSEIPGAETMCNMTSVSNSKVREF